MVLHVRRAPECNERQENPSLRGGSVELCSSGGLLGVLPKSHNVSHHLGIERFIRMNNIQLVQELLGNDKATIGLGV